MLTWFPPAYRREGHSTLTADPVRCRSGIAVTSDSPRERRNPAEDAGSDEIARRS